MADKVVELEVRIRGAQSIAELKAIQSETRKMFEQSRSGSQEQIRLGKDLANVGNELSRQRKLAATENAKMMHSYFTLGRELRSVKGAMIGVVDSLGTATGGLGWVLGPMVGPGGLLAGLTGGFALFTQSIKDTTAEIANAKRELLEFDRQAKLSYLESRNRYLKGGGSWLDKIPGGQNLLQIGLSAALPGYFAGMQQYNAELKSKLEIKKNEKEIANIKKEQTGEVVKQTDELYKQVELSRQREGMGKNLFLGGSMFALGGAGGGFGRGFGRRPMPRTSGDIAGAASQNVAAGGGGTYEEMFVDVPIDPTFERIKTAAQDAGDTIKRSIGGALKEALGFGDDLAGQLFMIALNLGLDLITGGIGGSLSAGGSSGLSSKSYGSSRNLSLSAPTIRLRGSDLYVSWQKQSVIHSIGAR